MNQLLMVFERRKAPSPRTPKAIRGSSPQMLPHAMAAFGRRTPGSGFAGAGMTAGLVLLAASAAAGPLPDPLEAGWKGKKVCEVMQETERLRMLKCTFPPGVGHERHFHAPHVGLILKGGRMRITDQTGTVERDLPTGGSWKSDGVDWHEAVNIGGATAIYIITEEKAP